MTETTTEQVKNDYKRALDGIEGIVQEVMELGTTWVRYGLTVGESALRTSAQSLSGVANVLHKVADQVQAQVQANAAEKSGEAAGGEAPKADAPATN